MKGSRERGRIMEGMNQAGYDICTYRNVTMTLPITIIIPIKMFFKRRQ
jgi:hypothetical protein